jgi:carbamoyltransferase
MRILGLSSFTHDGAAVVLEDGAIKAAIENDKIARQATRGLPEAAIRSCLETAETEWNSLDLIAVATQPLRASGRKSLLRARLSFGAPLASAYYGATEVGSQARQLNDLRRLRQRAAAGNVKVVTCDHHLSHAANAFYLSPFDRALILTADEDGDGTSTMLSLGEGAHIRALRSIPFPHSLAWVYSQVTDLAGFVPHREEHKTQWLSVEGEPLYKDVFLKILRGSRGPLPHLDYSFFNRGLAKRLTFSDKFYRETGLPSDPVQLSEDQRKALASSIQEACAEVLIELIRHFRRKNGIDRTCLSGGLFQNTVLVSSLEKALGADFVFVPPAPGNAGTAVGAALLAWHHRPGVERTQTKPNIYCGPRFTSQQIRDVLDNCKARYSLQNTEERKLDAAIELLLAGKTVGWFQNGSEFGPRALGNRSVLASPWTPYVKENLNDFIKHREWFRPFAIAIPEEDCEKYFEASGQCRFMNSLGWSRSQTDCPPPSFLLPGNRARLHVVERTSNPLFWRLLKRFGEQAPAPMLLNTSFNLFGEPLVITPRDALRSYFCSGLDAMIIGNFVLSKSPRPTGIQRLEAARDVGVGV